MCRKNCCPDRAIAGWPAWSPFGARPASDFYEGQAGQAAEWTAEAMCAEPFTFSHVVPADGLKVTFVPWVEDSLQLGLEALRRLL